MKVGYRKPSFKKSVSAKTKGKMNRAIKKATNPYYGKKGSGMIKDPKKALYNKCYNKTTLDVRDVFYNYLKTNSTTFNCADDNDYKPNYREQIDNDFDYLYELKSRAVQPTKTDINKFIFGLFLLLASPFIFYKFIAYIPMALFSSSLTFIPSIVLFIKSRGKKTYITLLDILKQEIDKVGNEWNRPSDYELKLELKFYMNIIDLATKTNDLTMDEAKDAVNFVNNKAKELNIQL